MGRSNPSSDTVWLYLPSGSFRMALRITSSARDWIFWLSVSSIPTPYSSMKLTSCRPATSHPATMAMKSPMTGSGTRTL